jgi:hypothetical protein
MREGGIGAWSIIVKASASFIALLGLGRCLYIIIEGSSHLEMEDEAALAGP